MEVERGQRVVPGVVVGLLSIGVNVGFALWFTPFLIGRIGEVAYGYIPTAVALISLASVAALALETSLNRSMAATPSGERADLVPRDFWTGLVLVSMLGAGLLVLLGLLVGGVDRLLVIEGVEVNSVRKLFAMVGCGFVGLLLGAPARALLYSRERLDLIHGLSMAGVLVKLVAVIVAFQVLEASVVTVGLALMVTGLAESAFAYLWVWRTGAVPVMEGGGSRGYSRERATYLVGFGRWMMLAQAGHLLFLAFDLTLVNRHLGELQAARYAVVLQAYSLIGVLASMLAGVFGPSIIGAMGEQAKEEAKRLVRQAVRFSGLLLAIITGCLISFCRPLLTFWLGEEWVSLAPLMQVVLSVLPFSLAFQVMESVNLGAKRLRVPGGVVFGLGIVRLVMLVLVMRGEETDLMKVGYVVAFFVWLRFGVFLPLYGCRWLGEKTRTYFLRSLGFLGLEIGVVALGFGVQKILPVTGLVGLIGGLILTFLVSLVGIFFTVLRPGERREVKMRFGLGKAGT